MKCPLVKYGDEGFACGHCGSTRTFSIENIGYHFRHCTEAKRKLEKLQEEQQLDALLSDDKKLLASLSKKRSPTAVHQETGKAAAAAFSVKKKKETKSPPNVLMPIRKSGNTLCIFMAYVEAPEEIGGDTDGTEDSSSNLLKSIQNILYAKDARTRTSHPLPGKLSDLARLLSTEKKSGVTAYTVSLDELNVNEERHMLANLSTKKFAEKVLGDGTEKAPGKWPNITFDQISVDWSNMPNSYIRAKNIQLFDMLESIAEKKLLNAGGAIYLPFKLEYYAVIAANKTELVTGYYNIDFINEDIVAEENHLYSGTVALGDAVMKQLNLEHIASDCVTLKQIGVSGDVQGIPMDEVKKHYVNLCKEFGEDYMKSVCTIRLQIPESATK